MENSYTQLASFLKAADLKPVEPEGKGALVEKGTPFSSPFLVELVNRIKNTLASVRKFILVSEDKFEDKEFWEQSLNIVNQDIKKMDVVLNNLLNYININTPLVKADTLHAVLEGILEANEKLISQKKIKIIKKLEKDIPETSMHDEQVRYILNSILQYAILSTPPHGTIGFLIKSLDGQKEIPDKKTSSKNNGAYVEIDIGFMGNNQLSVQPENGSKKEEATHLILELVKEIIHKNRGKMTFQVDQKKPRTLITLKLPIERRKVIYYEPINL